MCGNYKNFIHVFRYLEYTIFYYIKISYILVVVALLVNELVEVSTAVILFLPSSGNVYSLHSGFEGKGAGEITVSGWLPPGTIVIRAIIYIF